MSAILVMERDTAYRELIGTVLSEHRVMMLDDEQGVFAAIGQQTPQLVILDVESLTGDPIGVCSRVVQALRSQQVPVLVLTGQLNAEQQLAIFHSGVDDYLSKPFDVLRFITKVQSLDQYRANRDALQRSSAMVLNMQSQLVQAQLISNFQFQALYCRDLDELVERFNSVARAMGIGYAAKITTDHGSQLHSDSGVLHRLEKDMLSLPGELARITRFGHDRSLFNWPHTRLLVRHAEVGPDAIAQVLDGIEAGVKAVDTERILNERLNGLKDENQILKDNLDDLFHSLLVDLKDFVVKLGFSVELSEQEEDLLTRLVDGYNERFDVQLDSLKKNSGGLLALIDELRTPPIANGGSQPVKDESIAFF